MTYYTQKILQDATRKLQELINEFGKVAGYKIHRNLAFLYTNNERSEGETKETIPSSHQNQR